MTAPRLITDNLDLWTTAVTSKSGNGRGSNGQPELTGIKKLRELILELAVRGKLVPQDPADEPAATLLKKIAAEKARLVKEGKIKKPKPLPPVGEDEQPFGLPVGWEWTTLPVVASYGPGKTPSTKNSEYWTDQKHGFPWANIADMAHFGIIRETTKHISTEAAKEVFKGEPVEPGTILMSFKLTVGKVSINEIPLYHNEAIISLAPYAGVVREYLFKILPTRALAGNTKGAIKGNTLNAGSLAQILIPLPPLAEQHRIVEKVDELMALCDRLEQQTSDQLAAHETLVETLLDTLTSSADATELAANWTRLQTHFDTLFTTESSIDHLKQTILQLAVMGRLVPQDPNDEPASALLKKIAAEKDRLVKAGKIKKTKPLPEISEEEKPFTLPDGWEWCRFPDIGELARGKSKHRPRNDPSLYIGGKTPLVQTGDVARADRKITTFTALYNQAGVEQSKLWKAGTLCITIAANIGDTGILGFDACFPDSVVGFTPFDDRLENEYFEFFLRTAKKNLEEFAPSTAQKNINLEVLQNVLVPLPPAKELVRIVEKIDKLIALCGHLEVCFAQSSQSQHLIAEVMVTNAAT
ncbi:MAG: restriction endonuclease subunit S [Desulfurivibrio sp.]|nr:restriction endonuclease subunit S [Desulfurivibrio sp.]